MFLWISLCFIVFLIVVWFSVIRLTRNKKVLGDDGVELQQVPVSSGYLPVLGHLVFLLRNDNPDNHFPLMERLIRESGEAKTYQIQVLGRTYVITTNPEVVKHITSTKFEKVYFKGPDITKQYQPLFGRGIFNVNGEEWKRHRNVASGLFHIQKLKGFVDVFHHNAELLFEKLKTVNQQTLAQQEGIDMQDYFMRYTLDSFCEIGFGVRVGSINEDVNHFAIAFDKVQTHCERRGIKGKLWPLYETIFPQRDFEEKLKFMNEYTYGIIRQRQMESHESLRGRSDLLSQLLLSKDQKDSYSDEELRDFVMNFLIAGRDTTAMLLTWTFYLLAKHPEVEAKVIEEIQQVMQSDSPTWENIKSLKYLKNVLQETLRLYPPVPVDGYTALSDDVLPGGYYIEKGSEIYYTSYVMHRSSEFFENPNEFLPERWDTPLQNPFSYVPFHAGARTCLGKEMAFEEARIMIVNLLRNFRLRLVDGFEPEVKQAIILTSKTGMRMRLIPTNS